MSGGQWTTNDRLAGALLLVTLAIAALLGAAALSGPHPAAAGTAHPLHPSMLSGGAGAERAAPVLVLGWAYGALQILFFGICWVLSVRRRADGLGPLRWPTWIGLALYELAWAWLVWSYARFAVDPQASAIIGGFPAPTAIMLYVLWPLPLLFMGLYVWHFRSRLHTDADEARMLRLLEPRREDD